MAPDEAAAHVAIRDLLARAAQAGDARRAEAYAACFAGDGVLDLGGSRVEGRAALHDWMAAPAAMPLRHDVTPGFVSHHLTTCAITLLGDAEAKARTYWLVTTGIGLDHTGFYDDRLVAIDGRWLIAHRRPRTLWFAPDSIVGGGPA